MNLHDREDGDSHIVRSNICQATQEGYLAYHTYSAGNIQGHMRLFAACFDVRGSSPLTVLLIVISLLECEKSIKHINDPAVAGCFVLGISA